METNGRALIAMSGGVDSSVAVLRMQEKGYDCVGATMRLFSESAAAGEAAAVAAALGIPYHLFDFRNEFVEKVMDPFVEAYLAGTTPNPCIRCNRWLKFDRLLAKADELGCEKIATGHYARVTQNEETGRLELRRGKDPKKDQSYVLYILTQAQLSRVEFPLGELTKEQVREIARARDFSNAEKGESQDICFIPDGKYEDFVRARAHAADRGMCPGNIVDEEGRVLGTHRGYIGYTIGQRKGLGLSSTEPWYVTAIRPETNEVVVGRRESARGRELLATDFNWLSIEAPTAPLRAQAKTRYRAAAADCVVTPLSGGDVRVVFDEPQWAITRGQAVVVYDGDVVLGGGTICR